MDFCHGALSEHVISFLTTCCPGIFIRIVGIQIFSFGCILCISCGFSVFFYICLKKTEEKAHHGMTAFIFIFAAFAFPEFITYENMGRIDAVMAVLAIFSLFVC